MDRRFVPLTGPSPHAMDRHGQIGFSILSNRAGIVLEAYAADGPRRETAPCAKRKSKRIARLCTGRSLFCLRIRRPWIRPNTLNNHMAFSVGHTTGGVPAHRRAAGIKPLWQASQGAVKPRYPRSRASTPVSVSAPYAVTPRYACAFSWPFFCRSARLIAQSTPRREARLILWEIPTPKIFSPSGFLSSM